MVKKLMQAGVAAVASSRIKFSTGCRSSTIRTLPNFGSGLFDVFIMNAMTTSGLALGRIVFVFAKEGHCARTTLMMRYLRE